jgi:hypothetical protein
MKTIVVRYQAKPERADENQRLIEEVFAELDSGGWHGFTYAVYRLDDGVSFVHVATEPDDGGQRLTDVPAFQRFAAGVGDRCDVAPLAMESRVVGRFAG